MGKIQWAKFNGQTKWANINRQNSMGKYRWTKFNWQYKWANYNGQNSMGKRNGQI